MLEMPYNLRTLPPESLGLLRLFAAQQESDFTVEDLMETTGLSERGFGKAIRGLVTKQFVDMVSEGTYKLSNKGKRAIKELHEWENATAQADESSAEEAAAQPDLEGEAELEIPDPPTEPRKPAATVESSAVNTAENTEETSTEKTSTEEANADSDTGADAPRFVNRTMVIAAPRVLLSRQPTAVYIGFNDPDAENMLINSADLLLNITLVDGDGSVMLERETPFRVGNRAARQTLEVTGGEFTMIRLRVQVCQPGADEIDINADDCPGMYVDLAVTDIVSEADLRLAAYSANFLIRDE
jgi:hypothetical protein